MVNPDGQKTMKAWVYNSVVGGLEPNLKLILTPQPKLGANEVLVRVHSVSINPADYKLPEASAVARALLLRLPATPGMDFAGTIVGVGDDAVPGAESFRVGDRVLGHKDPLAHGGQHGTLAEWVAMRVPGSSSTTTARCSDMLVRLPAGVGFDDAACVGTAGMTAHQALVPRVAPGAGDRVVVNGASGGVGTFAVQIAAGVLGCRVTATCSAGAGLVRALGAQDVIDYRAENVVEALKARVAAGGRADDGGAGQKEGRERKDRYRVVVDNALAPLDLYKAADDYLLPSGAFVQVAGSPTLADTKILSSRMLLPSFLGGGKRNFHLLFIKGNQEGMKQMVTWMDEGKVKAVIDETFAFEDVPKAFAKLKTGRSKGKIVIHVSSE